MTPATLLRSTVRAITVLVPFAMTVAVAVAWFAEGLRAPVPVGSLGVRLDAVRVVQIADPDDERRIERAARRVAPDLGEERFSLMDHRRARYALARITVPADAQIPDGSRLLLTVSQIDPLRTSSWTWAHDSDAMVGWSADLDTAAAEVPWLSRRGSMPTASPTAVELTPGADVLVYAGLPQGSRATADDVAVGLVWLGPGGRLWDRTRLH